ncbi:MAG: LamG domain-containing protein, partial [Bacteriovoracia bacterium]
WALRVDSTGRVCFDAQTTASTGVWNTTAYKRMCSSEKITFAKWQHVGVVRSGGTVDLYINNKKVGTESMSTAPLLVTTLGMRVGAQARGNGTAPVEGLLDELHLWNVALTASQIEAAYARGVSGTALFSEPAAYATLFFPANYWRFDAPTPLDDSDTTAPVALTNVGADFVPNDVTAKVGDYYNFIAAELDRLVTAPVSLNLSGDFTLSLWVKPTTLTNTDILSKWNTALVAEQEFKLSLTAGGIVSFGYQLATPAVGSITSIEAIPAGSWTHVTVARRGPALYLYLNGRPQAVQNLGAVGILDLAARPLVIGGNTTTTATYFNGALDDVVLYKDYLNERNIRFNIDRGDANIPLPVAP